jgi:hypothetical protein
MNIPFLFMAQLAGRLHRRFSHAAVVGVGSLLGAAGILVLSQVTPATPFAVAGLGYVALGAGYGTLVPGIIDVAMRDVPRGVSGAASGILNAARQVGTSVGLAVLGAVGLNAAVSDWGNKVAGFPASVQTAAHGQAQAVAGAQISSVTQSLGPAYREPAVQSFLQGYKVAMLVAAGCTLAAAVIARFGLRERRARTEDVTVVPSVAPATDASP